MVVRDRIKSFRRVKASELIANKKNWRVHNDKQRSLLKGVLKDVGYASALIAREDENGKLILIDGHLRAETTPNEIVPVLVLDVTEEESDKLLATFDPLAEMADRDSKKLSELLDGLSSSNRLLDDYLKDQKDYLDKWDNNEIGDVDEMFDSDDEDEYDDEDYDGEEEGDDDSNVVNELPLSELNGMFEDGRNRTERLYHFTEFDPANADGFYQIPILKPTQFVPEKLLDFDELLRCKDTSGYTVHFFEYDSKFERLWRDPKRYIELFKQVGSIIEPDFSLYTQMPRANMIWNVYRGHLIGQMCQREGIEVIPRVRFLDETTYDFCFAGVPSGGTVCMSTIGFNEEDMLPLYYAGMTAFLKKIKPSTLIIYGKYIDMDYQGVPIKHIKNTSDTYRRGDVNNNVESNN